MASVHYLALLTALLLPGGLHGLFMTPLRHNNSAPRSDDWVSPIAGCQGFDCVLQYISLPDDTYTWRDTQARLHGQVGSSRPGLPNVSWTGYVLNMTSQRWRTGAQVNHPVWWHTLVVIIPDVVEFQDWATLTLEFGINRADGQVDNIFNRLVVPDEDGQAELWIDSHNLNESLHELKLAVLKGAFLAARTRAPAASLLNLPNDGEVFANDPVQMDRTQDYLKAYTYQDFLDHSDEPERIFELPTAKAVVRAMDTVSAFTAGLPTGAVKRFGVTGYSKLGTATYVAAAADSRVKAIVPMAIYLSLGLDIGVKSVGPTATDMIRVMRRSLYNVYPWTADVSYMGVLVSIPTPEFQKLSDIIDPLQFKDRVSVPKLIIWGANDEVCTPWKSQVMGSWDTFPGTTAFLEVPNAGHDEVFVKSLGSSAAFFRGILLGLTPPSVASSWDPARQTISLTQAGNTVVQPVAWRRWDQPLTALGGAEAEHYTPSLMQAPSQAGSSGAAWSAAAAGRQGYSSFVEVEFEWPEPGYRFKVSSNEYP